MKENGRRGKKLPTDKWKRKKFVSKRSSLENRPKTRSPEMSSNLTINVSVDNVKSWIKAGLISFSLAEEDEILDVTFGEATDGLGLNEFREWRADRAIPMHIKLRKKEVSATERDG